MIALIPARSGSSRIPGKNTKALGGMPLIEWTIRAAQASGVFEGVYCCTDSVEAALIGDRAGVPTLWRGRADDHQVDLVWVREALQAVTHQWGRPLNFALLRPTSPFRNAETIQRAFAQWRRSGDTIDSLRAVRLVRETPYKMWRCPPHLAMDPLIPGAHPDGTPYHSSPTQTLPPVYLQTGALEMGWTRNVEDLGTISGRKVSPFFCDGPEAHDINTERDWAEAERLLATGAVQPPTIPLASLSCTPA